MLHAGILHAQPPYLEYKRIECGLTSLFSLPPLQVKHTDCGMLTFQNDDAHGIVKKNLGDAAAEEVQGLDFLPFADLDEAVKDDVEFLRARETIPKDVTISGWVYDVKTGKARQVV